MCEGGSPELRIISGILHGGAKKKIRVYFPELGGGVRPNLENTKIFFNEPFPKVH